jgi:hypothetical protein
VIAERASAGIHKGARDRATQARSRDPLARSARLGQASNVPQQNERSATPGSRTLPRTAEQNEEWEYISKEDLLEYCLSS